MPSSPVGARSILAVVLFGLTTVSLGAVPSAASNLAAQVVGSTVSLTWAPGRPLSAPATASVPASR